MLIVKTVDMRPIMIHMLLLHEIARHMHLRLRRIETLLPFGQQPVDLVIKLSPILPVDLLQRHQVLLDRIVRAPACLLHNLLEQLVERFLVGRVLFRRHHQVIGEQLHLPVLLFHFSLFQYTITQEIPDDRIVVHHLG